MSENVDYEALAEQADRDREMKRLDDLEASLGMEPFTAPARVVTYSVLYSVPVPGLAVEAMAIQRVTVGPLGGKAYTTIRDIPKIIETRHRFRDGAVTVVSAVEIDDLHHPDYVPTAIRDRLTAGTTPANDRDDIESSAGESVPLLAQSVKRFRDAHYSGYRPAF